MRLIGAVRVTPGFLQTGPVQRNDRYRRLCTRADAHPSQHLGLRAGTVDHQSDPGGFRTSVEEPELVSLVLWKVVYEHDGRELTDVLTQVRFQRVAFEEIRVPDFANVIVAIYEVPLPRFETTVRDERRFVFRPTGRLSFEIVRYVGEVHTWCLHVVYHLVQQLSSQQLSLDFLFPLFTMFKTNVSFSSIYIFRDFLLLFPVFPPPFYDIFNDRVDQTHVDLAAYILLFPLLFGENIFVVIPAHSILILVIHVELIRVTECDVWENGFSRAL